MRKDGELMLLLVVSHSLNQYEAAAEWVTTAFLSGVRSRSGDVAVAESMGDEVAWRRTAASDAGLVVRMSDSERSERLLAAAAAATGVVWVSAEPLVSIRGHLRLDVGKASDEVPIANVVVSDDSVNEGLVRVRGSLTAVRAVTPLPTRKAQRELRKLGKWASRFAESHHRFDQADTGVRHAAAASVAEAGIADLLQETGVEEYQIRGSELMTVEFSRSGQQEVRDSPFNTDEELIEAARFFASFGGTPQVFDRMHPTLDVKVGERWRLHAEGWVVEPPSLVLRSNMGGRLTLEESGFADQDLSAILAEAIGGQVRANMVIAAPMFAGKTTLAQCLLGKVPEWERIDTIEDTAELGLSEFGIHRNTYARLTRSPNNEGEGSHTMADHIRHAKRAKTTKLVIGETRGEGTLALLDAMSSGLHGCLVTIHSGPGRAAVQKLVSYAGSEGATPQFALTQIALAVRLLVWVSRNSAGQRVVADVTEIVDFDEQTGWIETRKLWALEPGDRWAKPVCHPDGFMSSLYESAGVTVDPPPPAGAADGDITDQGSTLPFGRTSAGGST